MQLFLNLLDNVLQREAGSKKSCILHPCDLSIRVLLADAHPTLRLGLRVLLDREPDIEVVAEAESGGEALAKVLAYRPDVVVLDGQLPGLSGLEVAREIRQRGLPTRVLARMLEAGAVGYLLKEEAPEAILEGKGPAKLTEREQEMLRLMAEGLSN